MKWIALLIIVPSLALAAPPSGPGGADAGQRVERMQKRMRLARLLGLAEALDLDDAATLRARDVLARFDAKVAPLRKQLRDGFHILRDAANGDSAAAAQVEATLKALRETRDKLQSATMDMFQELTQGLTPEKKARAAIFLVHFQEHAARMMHRDGPGDRHGMGPRRGMGPGGMGPGGMGPGGVMEHHGMDGRADPGGPHDMVGGTAGEGSGPDAWFADE